MGLLGSWRLVLPIAVCVLVMLSERVAARRYVEAGEYDGERLIGWQGNTFKSQGKPHEAHRKVFEEWEAYYAESRGQGNNRVPHLQQRDLPHLQQRNAPQAQSNGDPADWKGRSAESLSKLQGGVQLGQGTLRPQPPRGTRLPQPEDAAVKTSSDELKASLRTQIEELRNKRGAHEGSDRQAPNFKGGVGVQSGAARADGIRSESAGSEQLHDLKSGEAEDSSIGLWVEQISWQPRAMIVHNIISDEEAQHIIDTAWPDMKRSTVVGENGTSVLDDWRTSYGTFLSRHLTSTLKNIEERAAELVQAPVIHQEDMQVLRYAHGQYYHRHTDSLDNDTPRMATLLIYLTTPEEGGETSFPEATQWVNKEVEAKYSPALSECARGHVAFKPRRGDGLLFWSTKPDGTELDPFSEHEGCPVLKGVKWTSTIWVHTAPFRPEEWNGTHFRFEGNQRHAYDDPGFCLDLDPECPQRVAEGLCTQDPENMKGGQGGPVGVCRASCGGCEICAENDIDCYNRNRAASNFMKFNAGEMTWSKEAGARDQLMG